MADNEPILLRQDLDGICTLTLNRPGQFNALSEALLTDLENELGKIADDDQVRVVILTGTGKAFCAGHDLKEMRSQHDEGYYRELFSHCSRVMQSIVNLPQPVIAMVQGIATAAGCQLVATCDLAVAADDVSFAVSGVNLGLFCSTPGVALSRNVSRKQALEMLLTGDFIDASTAVSHGLINRSVARDELENATLAMAQNIAAKPTETVRLGKQLFYSQIEKDLGGAYAQATDVMACNLMYPNTVEGVDAFIEKRKPDWK